MKDTVIIILAVSLFIGIIIFSDLGRNRTVIYDCRDAHWHPDVPIDVKKECSRLFKEYLDKQREEEDLKKRFIT